MEELKRPYIVEKSMGFFIKHSRQFYVSVQCAYSLPLSSGSKPTSAVYIATV